VLLHEGQQITHRVGRQFRPRFCLHQDRKIGDTNRDTNRDALAIENFNEAGSPAAMRDRQELEASAIERVTGGRYRHRSVGSGSPVRGITVISWGIEMPTREAVLLSAERPIVGALAVGIPGATLLHRNGLVQAVLPASREHVQMDDWGSPGTWEILSFPRQTPGVEHRVTNSRLRRRTRPPRSEKNE
jgi:hypothetical protein